MEDFDRLGASLEDAWAERRRDEERFPEAAMEVLDRETSPLAREALLDHLLDPHRAVPMQLAPPGAFGQPGFTVFHGHGFVIEIYHWLESLSAIHNHPFCGVFMILDGFSVHARYRAGPARALAGRAQHVPLTLEALELLQPGDRVPFSLRTHPLVHALVHVPRSSISMVVRTARTEGYFRYLPPSLALPMEGEAEPLGRQLMLLEALATANAPGHAARLRRFLERADLEQALRVLSSRWSGLDPTEREAIISRLESRVGPDAQLLPPVLDRAERLSETTSARQALSDPDLRLVAIALGYAERRGQVMDLLRARGLDPRATLHRFVDEAGLFAEGEEASAVIAHALVDGEGHDGALARLRQAYGAEAVAPHEADVARFCAASMFAVLDEDTDEATKGPVVS